MTSIRRPSSRTSQRIVWLTVLAMAAWGPAVASGAAPVALRARLVASHGATTAFADGRRFATQIASDGESTVFAERHGHLTWRVLGCRLGLASFGRAIGSCGDQRVVVDLATLQRVPIVGLQASDDLEGFVGAWWLEAATHDDDQAHCVLLNWRTGGRRVLGYQDRRLFDLNRLRVARRTLLRGDVLLGHADSHVVAVEPVHRLLLRHRGHVISVEHRCDDVGCTVVQYAAGIVTWAEPEAMRVCAYVVRTRRSGCWADVRLTGLRMVTHTAHGIFVGLVDDWISERATDGYETYFVPLRPLLSRPRR